MLTNLFVSEGVRLLEESLRHKMYPETVYYSESIISERGAALISKFKKVKTAIIAVSGKEIEMISDAKTSPGILGIFKRPNYGLSDISGHGAVLLMDNISDPGNAGTLIRSALAFGFGAVLYRDNTVDCFNPKVVRSSAGAIFGIPLIPISLNDIFELQKRFKVVIAVADLNGDDPAVGLKSITSKHMLILGIGSEAEGLSDDIKTMANLHFRIKHTNLVESLNAAVAGSLLMKDIYTSVIGKASR
ncbi:MAG: RNA methyltransferase [Candidatus Zixiibacteriota bacterium]